MRLKVFTVEGIFALADVVAVYLLQQTREDASSGSKTVNLKKVRHFHCVVAFQPLNPG